jgi:hypothetical protein
LPLSVDQAGAHRERRDRRHDQGKPIGEIVAVAGLESHAVVSVDHVASRHDAEAVVLDLVQPVRSVRRRFGRRRQAGFDEADRVVAAL